MPEPLFLTDDAEVPARILLRMNGSDMLKHFHIRLEFPSATMVRAVIDPVRDHQRGGLQSAAVNGGILAALFDLVLGMPGVTRSPDAPSGTMQLSINFMRAVRSERVAAEGWIERAGKGVLFTAARLLDDNGEVCATATGLVRLL
ncbi:MAG: PaaI family thioesterase [Myxococcota bacterium]